MSLTIASVAGALLLLALFAVHFYDLRKQQQVERMMDGILTRCGRATLDELTLLAAENRHVLERHHTQAQACRQAGNYEEAAERMALGCNAIERLAPDFVTALRSLRHLARSVSVIVGLPPIPAGAFRSTPSRGLATLASAGHHFLVTGQERIRLRLLVVWHVFRMSLRWLRRSTERVAEDHDQWQQIDALVHDIGSAGDETLKTAQRIVQALDALELAVARDNPPR